MHNLSFVILLTF